MPGHETELEETRRHVLEAEARLCRLEALATTSSHGRTTTLIMELIETMRVSLRLAQEHLARLEKKAWGHC